MVGTFYSAANPGLVTVRQRIGSIASSDDTTVCLVEAMKNFNWRSRAEMSGTIERVHCQER